MGDLHSTVRALRERASADRQAAAKLLVSAKAAFSKRARNELYARHTALVRSAEQREREAATITLH